MAPTLSILDQSPIASGRGPVDAIQETLALARLAEALGYARYWLAEHHNSEALAGPAPEILIAAIAATTSRIRVGSAGVMLPHYAALKVAEQFRVLEGIAPGRIDLGVGRAPGSDGLTALALNPNAREAAEQFPGQLRDLLGWLGGGLPQGHPFAPIRAQPEVPTTPQVWVLGSSDYGAQVAAHFGLPYCFAHFITDGRGAEEALALYLEGFRPGVIREPHAALCVFALAGETEAEARRLFRSRELWRLGRDRGVYRPLPSIEEAEAYPYTEADLAKLERLRARAIIGTGAQVWDRLAALAERCGAQEMAVLTATHDAEARRQSYALLAEAAGLKARDGAVA
ncbi:LLM class flavin-dependent oxidoreductase [Roseomonas sp. OT10]|uniref:LLM class flavin-dependent oxidoreductase n=1 Tax=Roseomonas cutis TaxID=2897332 RepID=UPI001E5BAB03|nr:LLM class flavin-dependent oxidoreductase [Roseomonas sp. OT10]UFN47063.1 LLM class flavin-dependent oxidoreductase [Roseomonas sp. OT10]